MGSILKRKDKTSIFCPERHRSGHLHNDRVKFLELIAACGLMVSGAVIFLL